MSILRKRYYYLTLGCISLFLLSVIYSWSIFTAPLEAEFGFSRSAVSSVFTVSMCMFGLGGLSGGILSRRVSHRIIITIAFVLSVAAFPIAAHSSSIIGLYLGYGVLGGLGSGIGYNAILGLLAKWFHNQLGVCNGVLLMGYALGSSMISPLCSVIIEDLGWRCALLFLGGCAACALLIALILITPPSNDEMQSLSASHGATCSDNSEVASLTTRKMFASVGFWRLLLWSMLLSGAGMAVISNASPIAIQTGIAAHSAIALISSLIAIGNGLGRLVVGRAADRFGVGSIMLVVNLGLPVSLLAVCICVYIHSGWLLAVGCFAVGFFYGGVPVCQTVATRTLFGDKYYTANIAVGGIYGMLASFIGPLVAGASYDLSASYLIALMFFAIIGFCMLFPLRKLKLRSMID